MTSLTGMFVKTRNIYLKNILVRGSRSSESDQAVESALVSLRYLDRLTGQEKTIREI